MTVLDRGAEGARSDAVERSAALAFSPLTIRHSATTEALLGVCMAKKRKLKVVFYGNKISRSNRGTLVMLLGVARKITSCALSSILRSNERT
jgi:hypothetical protein